MAKEVTAMFNTMEEDRFCDLYCDTVNRDWENSMQEMISYSEAELGMSRKQLDGLAGKRSWLVQKMRETQINTARYGLLEKKLDALSKEQHRKAMEFYREKRRHAKMVAEYRIESRKKRSEARLRFRNMTGEQREDLAKRYMLQGIGLHVCKQYRRRATVEKEKKAVRRVRKEARRQSFQRGGYAEGRKIVLDG